MYPIPDTSGIGSSVRMAVGITGLVVFWTWESIAPVLHQTGRVRHGVRNLTLTVLNAVLLGLAFGMAMAWASEVAGQHLMGLHRLGLPTAWRLPLVLVLLDGWLYLWHRANHAIPLLWRFHRVHHADEQMDVTTATRFHPGELLLSGLIRLVLTMLLGLHLHEWLIHDGLVVLATQFHHANVSLGRLDRPLRWLVVTPRMHQTHHSQFGEEMHSSYGVVLTVWDRLAGSFRVRAGAEPISFGVPGFLQPSWRPLRAMLSMPLATEEVTRTTPAEPAGVHAPAGESPAHGQGSPPPAPG